MPMVGSTATTISYKFLIKVDSKLNLENFQFVANISANLKFYLSDQFGKGSVSTVFENGNKGIGVK